MSHPGRFGRRGKANGLATVRVGELGDMFQNPSHGL